MLEVKPMTFAALAATPGFVELTQEYAEECDMAGLATGVPDAEAYAALEASGLYHGFAAFQNARLTGFLGLILRSVPHHKSVLFASVESVFVGAEYRKGGAGHLLIREAERFAKARGAAALFMSSPWGGRLEKLLPRLGYRETNTVFMKEL